MARYITITRGDVTYKRRVMTKQQKRAWQEKLRAALRAKHAKRKAGNGHAATADGKPASKKANGGTVPIDATATQDAARLTAQTEAALIHLRRGIEWLDRSGPPLRDLDPAHSELLNAHRALLGK